MPPCLVLAKLEDPIEGWNEIHITPPPWWRLQVEAKVAVQPAKPPAIPATIGMATKRVAAIKGDIDHNGAMTHLISERPLLTAMKDLR